MVALSPQHLRVPRGQAVERKADTGLIQWLTCVSVACFTIPYGTSQRDTIISVKGKAGGTDILQNLVNAKPVLPISTAVLVNFHLKQ